MCARTALATALALLGCGGEGPTLIEDPLAPFPESADGLGAYEETLAYETGYPFWSNGAEKERFIALPGPVDMSDPEAWEFPVGTLVFKAFRFPGQDDLTEVRVLRLGEERWDYAVYGPDGDLLDMTEPVPVPVTVDGASFDHLIPSRFDCRSCHESAPAPVLGYDQLGLGDDELDGVLGWLEANCTHCHNGGDGPSSAFDLRHTVAFENLICAETNESQTAAGYRVVPGEPEESIMFLAVSGETDDPEVKSMPPIGVQHRDAAGVELLRDWILSLEGECE